MRPLQTAVQLATLTAVHARFVGQSTHHGRSQAIAWSPCPLDGASVPVECGSLSVPLDYTNEKSNATLSLELIRIPAVNKPSKGSILFNFGGPGDSGKGDFAAFGSILPVLTGGYHDLILLVPRGTGNTLPFSCYSTAIERSNTQFSVVAGESSDVALGSNWASSQVLANACYATQNGTGGLIGTAFVARDMMRIVDALGEDGLLRYWGFSYGTVLGATVAAMFPDRMDKVILDGVVNIHEYYQNKEVEIFTDTDKVFTGFCTGCLASPSTCPLAHAHTTPTSLASSITDLFHTLKYHPLVLSIPNTTTDAILSYTTLRQLLLLNLYSPATWPDFATFLNGLLTHNDTQITPYLITLQGQSAVVEGDALPGIKCGDVLPSGRAGKVEEIEPVVEGRHRRSRIAGDAADHLPMDCALWRMDAKERYTDGFEGVRTRKPVLLIGNTADPVTPLVSARNVSAGLVGSVLLQHDGYGHSSLGQPSLCTIEATRAYFVNGTLPKPGTVCDVLNPLFSQANGWAAILEYFAAAGGNTTTAARSVDGTQDRNLRRWLVGPGLPRSLFGAQV